MEKKLKQTKDNGSTVYIAQYHTGYLHHTSITHPPPPVEKSQCSGRLTSDFLALY